MNEQRWEDCTTLLCAWNEYEEQFDLYSQPFKYRHRKMMPAQAVSVRNPRPTIYIRIDDDGWEDGRAPQ